MHSWIYKLATALVLTLITGSSMAMAQITIDTTGGAQVFGVQGNKVGSWTNSMFTVDTPTTLNNSTTFNNDVVFKNNMVVLAVAQAGTSCGTVGAIAQNGNGLVLSCQGSQNSNIWKVAQSNFGGTYTTDISPPSNSVGYKSPGILQTRSVQLVGGSSNAKINISYYATYASSSYKAPTCLVPNSQLPLMYGTPSSPANYCACDASYTPYLVSLACNVRDVPQPPMSGNSAPNYGPTPLGTNYSPSPQGCRSYLATYECR